MGVGWQAHHWELQMGLREASVIVEGHTACKGQRRDLNLCGLILGSSLSVQASKASG